MWRYETWITVKEIKGDCRFHAVSLIYPGKFYDGLTAMANRLRPQYQDAEIEARSSGEGCTGRTHQCKMDV
jgi:hypothetical protein